MHYRDFQKLLYFKADNYLWDGAGQHIFSLCRSLQRREVDNCVLSLPYVVWMLLVVSKLDFPKPSLRNIFSFFGGVCLFFPMYSVFFVLCLFIQSSAISLPAPCVCRKGSKEEWWPALNPEVFCQNSLPLHL